MYLLLHGCSNNSGYSSSNVYSAFTAGLSSGRVQQILLVSPLANYLSPSDKSSPLTHTSSLQRAQLIIRDQNQVVYLTGKQKQPALYTSPIMAFTMHSHSGQFCPGHAVDQLEDIVKHAISIGYKTIGLTEHMPRYEERDLYPEEVRRFYTKSSH